ncbi:MAG TPA: CHAT domain-containing protein [Coleofasciculaceae cyanobacterium]
MSSLATGTHARSVVSKRMPEQLLLTRLLAGDLPKSPLKKGTLTELSPPFSTGTHTIALATAGAGNASKRDEAWRAGEDRTLSDTSQTFSNSSQDNIFDIRSPDLSGLLQQGRDYYETGQFAQAARIWEQVALSLATHGDGLNQAMVLSNLSLAYQHLGEWTQAKVAIAKSLDLLATGQAADQQIAQARVLAQALNTQGRLQLALGQTEQALATWQQAAEAYRRANDAFGMLRSQINQAQALKSLGLYRRAVTTLSQVHETLQKQPDSPTKATGLRSLGSALLLVGELEQSRQILQQSLNLAQQLQSDQDIGATLFDLGNTARAQQDVKVALDFYQQAAAIATSPTTKIQAQLNQLSLLIEQKQESAIQTLWPQIHAQLGNLSPSRATIYAHIDLGMSLMKLSALHPDSSVHSTQSKLVLETALQQAKSIGDKPAEAYALGTLGRYYEQTQQLSDAQHFTEQALLLAQAINVPDIAYRFSWQLGRLLKAQGNTQGAIAAYTEAVQTLQTLRSNLLAVSPDVQFSFTESVEPVYRQLVSLLLPLGSNNPTQQNLAQARDVIESLQLAELENFFREACLNAKPQQIDQIDPTGAVIYPIILPDHLAVILSLPGQSSQKPELRYYETKLPQREVENMVDETIQSLNPALPDKQRFRFSQQVYDWLIRPAEAQLAESKVKTLVFVLDGSLRNLPMAALHDGNQYLVEKYNIALAPGLQLLNPKPLPKRALKTLTAGLTQGRQGFAPLENVMREVEQIQTELPSVVLLDRAFTSDAFQNKIESSYFPVVHIATHGQFSSKAEETFVLTWDGRINAKQFHDILQPANQGEDKAIELLVLSACQTAQGDKQAALGLAGVAVRAGAQSTLATLWRVNDVATADLMALFYRELTDTTATKAEALRHAQLTLLKNPRYKHPFYWAPFILVGNWL